MIAGVLWRGWRWMGRGRVTAFRRGLAHPQATQQRLLRGWVRRHADTVFGRRYGFAACSSAEDYRARVPLGNWVETSPYVDEIRKGTVQVLTRDPVERLVPTSSSSAARKLIPWTPGLAEGFAHALAPWLDDVFRHHPLVQGGPAYWCISPPPEEPEVGIGFATDRAYMGGIWQNLLGRAMAVPDGILGTADPLGAALAHLLACRDLRLISVWHPSFLDLMLDRLAASWPDCLHTLEQGDPAIGLGPQPRRAQELAGLAPDSMERIWPRLGVVSAWADGPARLPAAALIRRLGHVPFQAKGLLATEGVVTIPFGGAHPLAITSGVYEFLDDKGRCHWAEDLVLGGEYEVVLTNGGGLWRYRLGDRVRVVGHLGRTPCLEFLGRIGTVHDLAGEKLDEGLAAQVLAAVVPQAGFAALQPQPGHRRWALVVDVATVVDPALAQRLDEHLTRIEHWRHARRLGQLAPPVVVRSTLTRAGILAVVAEYRRQRLGEVKPPVLLSEEWDLVRLPGGGPATG